jgi:hypothetical protein
MKVLMFGWEFPPHITGGLGTACYGLVKGLAKHGLDIVCGSAQPVRELFLPPRSL